MNEWPHWSVANMSREEEQQEFFSLCIQDVSAEMWFLSGIDKTDSELPSKVDSICFTTLKELCLKNIIPLETFLPKPTIFSVSVGGNHFLCPPPWRLTLLCFTLTAPQWHSGLQSASPIITLPCLDPCHPAMHGGANKVQVQGMFVESVYEWGRINPYKK